MRIALAQLNYHIGNFEANEKKIIEEIKAAKELNVDLIIFAELAICGYPPRDFLEFDDFIEKCSESISRIAEQCFNIAAIIGAPSINEKLKGKRLHNSALFLVDGKVLSVHHKHLLPTYDVFDENRYFEAGEGVNCINYKGQTIALTICEDLWNTDDTKLYKSSPMEQLCIENPDFIVNIAASPFSQNQVENRERVFKWNTERYNIPIIYVNHVGAQTELIFDGNSVVYNSAGELVEKLAAFKEEVKVIESNNLVPVNFAKHSRLERIESALIMGISDYFKKLNFKKATLGLSGGIDSALTLTLAVKALGKENVLPILMPSQFSSDHSIKDSEELCKKLGCNYHTIAIKDIYNSFDQALEPLFNNTDFGIAEENIQSRTRGTLLMAHTNKFGTILLNTSNKSELAVGYGTLYGDMSGGLSVLGDVYKTEVFELAKYINRNDELIPDHIITKPPSAELRPDQKDSDSLPDYEILDAILRLYIEQKQSPSQIIAKGFNTILVKRVLRMVNMNEYKRHQTPPILRISEKAFGMGRRMPIVAKYLS